jgi:DNA-binding LacI/PurR family transcriptional regulator
MKVTYRTIAKETGFSLATVYLAFNRSPKIPEDTRDRILSVAQNLGYQPSPSMRRLMMEIRKPPSARQHLEMGFVSNWSHPLSLGPDEPLKRVFSAAAQRAVELGYTWREYPSHESVNTLKKIQQEIRYKSVNGVLIFPPRHTDFTPALYDLNVPIILVGLSIPELPYPCVESDHYQCAETSCLKLLEAGCKRIGFIKDAFFSSALFARFEGAYLATLSNAGLPRLPALVAEGRNAKLIAEYVEVNRCDGILTVGNCNLASIRRFGATFCKSLRMACYGGRSSADDRCGVSGIDEQSEVLGRVAVEHLARAIETHENISGSNAYSITIPGRWISGKTIQPLTESDNYDSA